MTPAKWHPSRRSRWRIASIITALAAVLSVVGLLGSGVAAQAATSPGAKSVTFQVKMLRTPSGQLQALPAHHGVVPADDEIIINSCTVQVNDPHNSSHVGGNVNVVGTMNCIYPVTESYLDIELYYNGEDYAYGESYLGDTTSNMTNAAMACENGTYYADFNYTIYFGPTWTPDEASGELVSNVVDITC
jgi:hypothetical protein